MNKTERKICSNCSCKNICKENECIVQPDSLFNKGGNDD